MANIGFTYYDAKPTPPVKTLQELIAELSGPKKLAILDGFANGILPKTLCYTIPGLKRDVVKRLYQAIDNIEETARSYMREEVLITPAETDPETGEVITPAVYNTKPSSQAELLAAVQAEFEDIFTSAQVNAVLSKMVAYSKWDGTGDWTFYAANVIL